MTDNLITRRESLTTIGAATAGLLTWNVLRRPAAASVPSDGRKRAIRIAHLTDIHVEPELHAGEGMAACLRHVHQLADPPELIITGGDAIMESLGTDDARTQVQWDLWKRILKNECSIPVRSCIGNHDIWGWAKSKSGTTGNEPLWGKKRAVAMLGLEDRYYRFSQAGWEFIILDSTQPLPGGGGGYSAYLDEEQYDWLTHALRDVPADTPVMIVSHIPILSTTPLIGEPGDDGNSIVSRAALHIDRLKLKKLFARHPNVRICLSGHIHLLDRVDYNGVTYLCNGAVCGNWWGGRHIDCDEGYAIIDLYDDGSFDHQYLTYGWEATG